MQTQLMQLVLLVLVLLLVLDFLSGKIRGRERGRGRKPGNHYPPMISAVAFGLVASFNVLHAGAAPPAAAYVEGEAPVTFHDTVSLAAAKRNPPAHSPELPKHHACLAEFR